MGVKWDMHMLEVASLMGVYKVLDNLLFLASPYRSCAAERQRGEWVAIL